MSTRIAIARRPRATARAARAARAVAALAVAALAGCGDLLTEAPKDQLTSENFYKTDGDAVAAIAAAYRPLSDANLFGTSMKTALIIASDEGRSGRNEANAQIIALSSLAWNPSTPRVTEAWPGWYDVITKANTIIERVPAGGASTAARDQVIGEAKFLRALGYFYLVRLYGDVPLVTTTAEQAGQPARTPKEAVFTQIIKDATEAEAALPVSWNAANKGRAPKGAAQALLAEVYLWRSSAEGKNEWQLAAGAAQRVIASNAFALEPNYLNAFLPGSQNRREEIFAAQASAATNAPTVRTASIMYPQELGGNSLGGFGATLPSDWVVAEGYAPGDYRLQVSVWTSGLNAAGRTVTFPPHIHKYRPSTRPGPEDANWPIYRYAEVLLFRAEALNELGDATGAVALMNQIRARARLGTGTENRPQPANYTGPLTQAALRDSIFEERRREMAFEGDRWFDIVRRGYAYFTARLARDPLVVGTPPEYKMLWPIPQREIDVNPNLTQNPGY
jgi:hypothetical protein